jgi:hypothetical protein
VTLVLIFDPRFLHCTRAGTRCKPDRCLYVLAPRICGVAGTVPGSPSSPRLHRVQSNMNLLIPTIVLKTFDNMKLRTGLHASVLAF